MLRLQPSLQLRFTSLDEARDQPSLRLQKSGRAGPFRDRSSKESLQRD